MMLGLTSNFSAVDWAIVVAYLLGTLAVGVYVNRYVAGMSDYIVAGRSLKSYLSIATMVGSELGLVTVMYAAQKGFTGGFSAMHIGLVAGTATLVIGLTGFIVVPLRRLRVMTIPQYYGERFSPGVRVFGALVLAVAGILNMGLFLRAGAIFLTGLTGLNDPVAVKVVMTVLILLVLVYTVLGGMVAVVITDYLQFVLLSFGMIAACVIAVVKLGWGPIVESVRAVHGDAGFDPFHGEGFGLSYVVWMVFVAGIVSCAVWQTAVMRACAAENEGVVRRLYAWSSIGFMVRFMAPQFLGICALAYFWHDPQGRAVFFDAGGAVSADTALTMGAMPIFLGQLLPVGMIGLIGAAMLAAFMSTHDSYLLCWASVLAHDVAGPVFGKRLSERGRLMIARVLIVLIGVFLLIWSLWYPLEMDLWDYMAVTGAVYFTGAFAVLLTGLYWKRASTAGAYLALTVGVCAVLGLGPVQQALGLKAPGDGAGRLFGVELTGETVGLSTAGLALVVMVIGSLLVPGRGPAGRVGEIRPSEGGV
jgi:solute:Na+ symporter, SSS family